MSPNSAGRKVVLSVKDLHTEIKTENGVVHAVDGVSFDLHNNEVLAIVGESGCGKSVTALSILKLLPKRVSKITQGSVMLGDLDLTKVSDRGMRKIRGKRIAMIFQDALTGLNPVHRVGDQIAEMILTHQDVSKRQAHQQAIYLLDQVGIPNASERADRYVHEFSGGMRQRAMIAVAMALEPEVLIADEPTTALDVTVQAQVLEVLLEVKERIGSSIILITHDLGVVAGMADRVMVMYAGRIIEEQSVDGLYHNPMHPYAWGLLNAMPRVDEVLSERLASIPGAPPSLIDPPKGCRFASRCPMVEPLCEEVYPEVIQAAQSSVACHFADRPNWSRALWASKVVS